MTYEKLEKITKVYTCVVSAIIVAIAAFGIYFQCKGEPYKAYLLYGFAIFTAIAMFATRSFVMRMKPKETKSKFRNK